ncbi:MAG: ImmA/IrrE family metallo-endopeptidase [Dehalococcoidia bacterium]|nr:ImmA/IrrE family metallo-endopeptidase [Dehalococcoidia bacterium]
MVRWVKDTTGRFPERPHYDPRELDADCEGYIEAFLRRRHGTVSYPIDTEDLTVLLEDVVDALDQYADLSEYGDEIHGVTEFHIRGKPVVRISKDLTIEGYRSNRLRTTLTHELGHVRYHNFLWKMVGRRMTATVLRSASPRCHRSAIVSASQGDWMEWQAAYACGAFLMPKTAVVSVIEHLLGTTSFKPIFAESVEGRQAVGAIHEAFQVSEEAARVRLYRLTLVTPGEPVATLFDSGP